MKADIMVIVDVCLCLLALLCCQPVVFGFPGRSTGGDTVELKHDEIQLEGAGDACTRDPNSLTTDQLRRWIASVSTESNRTYITADSGNSVFTAGSDNQAIDAFLTGITGKVTEIWMNNSPCVGICGQKLIQKFQKKPPKIHISHLYSPGGLELEAKKCLAKMVKLKFKIDAIDWLQGSLYKSFTNVQCRNLVKGATGSQKFNDAMDKLRQQLQDVQQMSKDPNASKYCTVQV